MATKIITKNGSGAPSDADLLVGELAVDLTNKRLYTKDTNDNILELGTNPGPDFPFPDQNGLTISDVAPLDPNEGDQWLNSDTAEVFIFDGAVWLEFPGGKDGAPGADGADGKQIWSEVTPDGDIYYDKGNVGVGNDSPNARLTVGTTIGVDIDGMMATIPSAQINPFIHAVSNTYNTGSVAGDLCIASRTNVPASVRFFTGDSGPVERLKIDAAGTATFSGTIVPAGGQPISNSTHPYVRRGGGNLYVAGRSDGGAGGNLHFCTGANEDVRLTIDASGTATFSGSVTVDGNRPVSTKLDLINTLSTLRNATKDETTLEGLRDAIGNAIGGLIEEFENQIATMPAEEPEVSTMPAEGDES